MENEKIICKAEIKANPKRLIFWLYYIILIAVCLCGIVLPTLNSDDVVIFGKKGWDFYGEFLRSEILKSERKGMSYNDYIAGFKIKIYLITGLLFLLPILFNMSIKIITSQCSLSLTDSGVSGNLKKVFLSRKLQLPIDKVDNAMISESIFDKLFGGKTVSIRSTSGLIKFHWVQNADEFVNATLEKIEEFKQSVKEENKNLVSAMAQNTTAGSESSAAAKIKELKELFDSGLISQDEFDAKRKEFLDKM